MRSPRLKNACSRAGDAKRAPTPLHSFRFVVVAFFSPCFPPKVLEEESAEAEARRKGLEEAQEAGKQELDIARGELKHAADRLAREKEDLTAARKVTLLSRRVLVSCFFQFMFH